MIHVAFGSNNLYAKFAGTAMLSMFENVPPPTNSGDSQIIVHFLHDNSFSQENHDKFVQIAEQYHQQVEFHNLEGQDFLNVTMFLSPANGTPLESWQFVRRM